MSYDEAVSVTAPAGWRALVVPRADSTTVALQWTVDAGSRHDGDQPGLARLTAELAFGVATSPTHPDLIAPLEALGAEGHSTTTREYVSFQAVVAAPQREALWTLIPALARPPLLTDAALARARATIAQSAASAPPPAACWATS
jgi:predicted Zn-dependent peptidase